MPVGEGAGEAADGSAGGATSAPVNPNAGLIAELIEAMRRMSAPKRVVRDAHGRVSHLETVPPAP
jgi:hypothetical protein